MSGNHSRLSIARSNLNHSDPGCARKKRRIAQNENALSGCPLMGLVAQFLRYSLPFAVFERAVRVRGGASFDPMLSGGRALIITSSAATVGQKWVGSTGQSPGGVGRACSALPGASRASS